MPFLPDDNIRYPVLIDCGGRSGSGFLLGSNEFRRKKKLFLCTARHVLYEDDGKSLLSKSAVFQCSELGRTPTIKFKCDLDRLQNDGAITPHANADLAVAELAELVPLGNNNQVKFRSGVQQITQGQMQLGGASEGKCKKLDDAGISNEVFIFGYPNSIGIPCQPAHYHSRPLVRKGTIAGKNYLNQCLPLRG